MVRSKYTIFSIFYSTLQIIELIVKCTLQKVQLFVT